MHLSISRSCRRREPRGGRRMTTQERLYMRVLFRVALALLIAIPVCLALTIFFALEVRRAKVRLPGSGESASSESVGLGSHGAGA
jgi:hypothetical protein